MIRLLIILTALLSTTTGTLSGELLDELKDRPSNSSDDHSDSVRNSTPDRGALKDKAAVLLPISGLMFLETPEGIKVISNNGRYLFEGSVTDLWSETVIDSLEDAKTSASTLSFNGTGLNLDELAAYRVGSGPRVVSIFVDPLCPHCENLLRSLPQKSEEYTFNLIPIPVLGKQSIEAVKLLECSTDPEASLQALLTKNYAPLKSQKPDCSMDALTKRMMTAQVIGIDVVPFVISPTGKVMKGAPRGGLLAWLKGVGQ